MTRTFYLLNVALISASTVFASGCATTSREEARTAAQAAVPATPFDWASVQQSVGDVQVGWIAEFNDPLLTQLVREAQANNIDLQAAAANVERSVALARKAGAALKPQVDLSISSSRSGVLDSPQGSTDQGNTSAGFQFRYEVDIWGRIRGSQQAAVASAEAAQADYVFAQYSLAAGVARSYFTAIEAGLQQSVSQKTVTALNEIQRIVNVQHRNGIANGQDVALARTDLATAKNALELAKGAQRDAIRALEILLGRYPAADLAVRSALPAAPQPPPAGLPSQILERRPDLISAERSVAAAFNSLDSAKAARLPAIALTADIGGSSESLTNLLSPANVAWTLASNLLTPLIDGGARKAQVEVSTAEQQQAVDNYAQVALNAFGEVESNLDQGSVLELQRTALADAATQAAESYRIVQLRYNEGETDLIDALSIQQRVFAADSNLVSIQRQILEQRVNLNLALGGDWDTRREIAPQ